MNYEKENEILKRGIVSLLKQINQVKKYLQIDVGVLSSFLVLVEDGKKKSAIDLCTDENNDVAHFLGKNKLVNIAKDKENYPINYNFYLKKTEQDIEIQEMLKIIKDVD